MLTLVCIQLIELRALQHQLARLCELMPRHANEETQSDEYRALHQKNSLGTFLLHKYYIVYLHILC